MKAIIDRQSDTIALGIYEWLNAEVQSSHHGTNEYLDNFDNIHETLTLGYENPRNIASKKNESHMDRLPIWWQGFEMLSPGEPGYDYQAARITFAGLVFVSGAYRTQCYIQAKDAEDYKRKRDIAVGTNIVRTTKEVLASITEASGDLASASIDAENLKKLKDKVASLCDFSIKHAYRRLEYGYNTLASGSDLVGEIIEQSQDLGRHDTETVKELTSTQYNWLTFLVHKIIFDAKVRGGDLRAVPFLDATSISKDPEVYYPFNGESPPVLAKLEANRT